MTDDEAGFVDDAETLLEAEVAAYRETHRTWLEDGHLKRLGFAVLADGVDGQAWQGRIANVTVHVIWSMARENDGEMWLHISLSKRNGVLPHYAELTWLHKNFVGEDRIAYQVFAPRAEHVNIHPGVLHLWAPIGHRPTPDFTRGARMI